MKYKRNHYDKLYYNSMIECTQRHYRRRKYKSIAKYIFWLLMLSGNLYLIMLAITGRI